VQVNGDEDSLIEEIRLQTAWLRVLAMPVLRAELNRVLTNDKRRAVYELSTGKATTRDVASAAGVGAGTVSRWWAEWEGLGLMRPAARQGRVAHIVSLRTLGMAHSDDRRASTSEENGEE